MDYARGREIFFSRENKKKEKKIRKNVRALAYVEKKLYLCSRKGFC